LEYGQILGGAPPQPVDASEDEAMPTHDWELGRRKSGFHSIAYGDQEIE